MRDHIPAYSFKSEALALLSGFLVGVAIALTLLLWEVEVGAGAVSRRLFGHGSDGHPPVERNS